MYSKHRRHRQPYRTANPGISCHSRHDAPRPTGPRAKGTTRPGERSGMHGRSSPTVPYRTVKLTALRQTQAPTRRRAATTPSSKSRNACTRLAIRTGISVRPGVACGMALRVDSIVVSAHRVWPATHSLVSAPLGGITTHQRCWVFWWVGASLLVHFSRAVELSHLVPMILNPSCRWGRP